MIGDRGAHDRNWTRDASGRGTRRESGVVEKVGAAIGSMHGNVRMDVEAWVGIGACKLISR